MIELINNQSNVSIDLNKLKAFAKTAVSNVPQAKYKSLTIVFTNDDEIKALNAKFRGKNYSTDVLSFPNESDEFDTQTNYLGDIIISADKAKKQAKENGLSLELEIKQLILHGILHLCGYDHETDNGEMNALELKLRDKLGIN